MVTTASTIWLRLQNVTGLNADQRYTIVEQLQHISSPSNHDLMAVGLNARQQQIFCQHSDEEIETTLGWLEQPGHHLITWGSQDYPPLLTHIPSPPPMFFVRGALSVLRTPQLAIVGSRQPSIYGRQWGTLFSQTLALHGLTLTSGLALGIDSIAHNAALDVQQKTVAVLGNGLLHCYPKRHQTLAESIVANGGALVSEFALQAKPLNWHFPRRNRIISGLSLGVLIVEATIRSGSLVTARHALEQNREIFALPGAIGNPGTQGTHWLIQQGASLVSHPDDIIEALHSDLCWLPNSPKLQLFSIDGTMTPLPFADVLANVGDEVTSVDVVAKRAGQPVPIIVAKLLELELSGWIAAVPGGYVRLRRAGHVRRTHLPI